MSKFFYSKIDKFISFALCILGFASCARKSIIEDSKGNKFKEIRVMYGVPTATYQISGKVVDSDGKPMSGLKVYPREVNMGGRDNSIFIDVADTTDAEGNFNIDRRITSLGDKDVNLIIEELDKDSKVVKSDTVKLELKNKTKRKGFDMGVFTAKKKKIKFSK